MARRFWKLKLTILMIFLLLVGGVGALFPLKVLRLRKTEKREVVVETHFDKLPVIGKFFPVPKEIPIEEQPTLELQVIAQQRRELELRESKYKEEMERLAKVKEDIDNQRLELKKIRDELEILIGSKDQTVASESSEKDKKSAALLGQLAKSYEKMDPAAAAQRLSAMQEADVVKILSHMREKYVSRIIEAMTPEKAAQISAGMIRTK